MAAHYTCDRCGIETRKHGHERERAVSIGLPDAVSQCKSVVLRFDVIEPNVIVPIRSDLGDARPDLCDDCLAHVLRVVASMLDTDRIACRRPRRRPNHEPA